MFSADSWIKKRKYLYPNAENKDAVCDIIGVKFRVNSNLIPKRFEN